MTPLVNIMGAARFVPHTHSLSAMGLAIQDCKGCPLYAHATQAVFGEGKKGSRFALIGEQPGHDEDRQGEPFVGPAGRVLSRALEAAGLDPDAVYVTNAVKHKRRLHTKPTVGEVAACRPWLEVEMRLVRPEVLVALGTTAAYAVFGPRFELLKNRGKVFDHPWAKAAVATIHPSAILRAPESGRRKEEFAALVEDFKKIRRLLY